MPPRPEVREVASLFLRLGLSAFGGPAAHIAMMEDEVVRRRRWLDRPAFLDLVGAVHLIPGPNSTELAILLGYRRAGWAGLATAGACFILPAAGLTLALAWGYRTYGALPQAQALLYGVKPVVLAVLAQALWGLGRPALQGGRLAAVALASAAAAALGADELAVLLGAGLAALLLRHGLPKAASFTFLPAGLAAPQAAQAAAEAAPATLAGVFLFFLKVGSVLYGSGYVLLAFMEASLVERWGWLTRTELLDAVAAGQMTPGPVLTTATFVGYLLRGAPGAAAATLGVFLPSFVFAALGAPHLERLRSWERGRAFLDGVNAASLALMAVVSASLARSAVLDAPTAALAAGAAVLLLRYRVNSAWLVLGGAAAGLALR